jgi:recombinational DNA repair ATPase RecF
MQRNAWLKKEAGVKRATFDQDPWREQLIAYGVQLGNFRAGYVDQLREPFADAIRRLAPSLAAELRYEWGGWDTAESAEKKLGESFARDVKLGVTHRGPHRSDLMVPVRADEVSKRSAIVQLPGEEVDNQRGGEGAEKDPEVAGEGEGLGSARMGIDAASTLSRGQAELVASAAILAQATLQHQLTASRSMFLIDDFGAELDSEHWRLFLAALQSLSCQVIATSTSAPEHHLGWLEGSEARLFHVKQGRITRG